MHEGLDRSDQSLEADPQDALVRVLGGEPDVEMDLVEMPLDGGRPSCAVYRRPVGRVVPESIAEYGISRVREPQRIRDFLVDAALRDGGTDDITVLPWRS